MVAGAGGDDSFSTTDPDHLLTKKTILMAQTCIAERNDRNSKENSSSRSCRCAAGASNKISGRTSVVKSSTSIATNTNTVELLQNPKTLPIREFEKLSPVVSAMIASSARSSESSVSSCIVDAISGEKTTKSTAKDTNTTSTKTKSNCKIVAIRNMNKEVSKIPKNETADTGSSVETIYLNVLNKKFFKKVLQSDENSASLTESKSSSSEKELCLGGSGSSSKRLATDGTLILRICDLEYAARRSSTSPICTTTQNVRSTSIYNKAKIKVRTKTDPHPVSSTHKQRRFSSSTTSIIDLKNYQKCLSQNVGAQPNGSKCNCSSCYGTKSSTTSSSQNKMKSVGTQHNAATSCAFDPWVKQSTIGTYKKRGQSTKSDDTTANPLLKQKSAKANAKIIVITDDFKKKALNQEVLVDTKRKILRYMKANELLGSSRSMDDVRIATTTTTSQRDNKDIPADNMNEHQMNSSVLSIIKSISGARNEENTSVFPNNMAEVTKTKAISKSVDNISVLSTDLDALDDVGSVELIFISDEFLHKVSDQDVIVLKNNSRVPTALVTQKLVGAKSVNGNSSTDSTSKNVARKRIVVITDEFCRKSIKNKKIVIVDEPNKNENVNKKQVQHQQLNRQSSAESSVDNVNNKITSRAFQSYDEEAEHLESKEIQ